MPITLRNTKGSELTFAELDGNFTHLENEINTGTDSSTIKTFIDTTYVTGIVDQTYIEGIVDSAFVNARVNTLNSLDSAEAIQLIDSAYVQARQVDIRDSAFVTDIIDSAYIIARQEDNQRDSAFVTSIVDSDYVQTFADTMKLRPYTVATVPSGVEGQLIYVTDGNAGDATLALFTGGSFKVVSTIGATILDSGGGF
mgnify:FL=1